MKDNIICLSGAGVCFVFGVIAFIMGNINVALTWCVGITWALLASYHAKQAQIWRDATKEAIDIMDETKEFLK